MNATAAARTVTPTLRGKAADAIRRAAHLTHETRTLKSAAGDALEDSMHRARRAWKRGARELADYRDEAAHRVRRQPFTAVGAAVGAGLFLGILGASMLMMRRRKSRR